MQSSDFGRRADEVAKGTPFHRGDAPCKRLYTSCSRVRRVLQIYYLTVRLLIIFSPKASLTPVFKPGIVELSISAIAEDWLSMDCVKRFKRLEEDSGIMAQRKRHRKNRTGSFSDDPIGYMRRYM